MKRKCLGLRLSLIAAVCSFPVAGIAQQTAVAGSSTISTTATVVPTLVNYSGTLTDLSGKPLSGMVGVTFSLYKDPQGGAPLWMETQSVPVKSGHYAVVLGSTTSQGLPEDVFVSGEARWLGVQASGQAEQPRVLLVAVPYALKAHDAETIGGLPPSAFVMAPAPGTSAAAASPTVGAASSSAAPPPNSAVTGAGTINFLPLWDTTSDIVNSVVFQSGTGTTARIGINTTTPAATLDVKGAGTFRGALTLPSPTPATTAAGKISQPLKLVASAFNSGTGTPVNQIFSLQAEPVGNNTASTSGTLNLLYASGTNTAAETGLHIASNGQITFAAGQSFPGAGTVTSVGSGAGLTGGPITGSGTLSIAGGGVSNSMLQNSSLTVNATSPLTGGGSVALGGSTSLGLASCASGQILKWSGAWTCAADANSGGTVSSVASGTGLTGGPITTSGTLSVNPAVVPELGLVNTFTNIQAITTNNSASGLTVTNTGVGNGITSSIANLSNGLAFSAQGGFEGFSAFHQEFPVVGATDTGGAGVDGINNNGTADNDSGVIGLTYAPSGSVYGVLGSNVGSPDGAGVYGVMNALGPSVTASNWNSGASGVWGDGGAINHYGVLATADNHSALIAENNASSFYTLYVSNGSSSGSTFGAYNAANKGCQIDYNGNINCTGAKNAVVPIDGGAHKVALSAIESPENWFEDFGSATLSNGGAVVRLEPRFGQTVNTEVEYHVFLTPDGDCNGLYVRSKTPTEFEVRELNRGTSNVHFDYRIVALRKNYETIRLADHTNDLGPMKFEPRKTPLQIDMKRLVPPNVQANRAAVQNGH